MYYETIIVGGGAAGLFCGASLKGYAHPFLILEKNKKAGIKLLVSGSGQCNYTHSGDIKDFVQYYGENGKKIRGILFRFNNQMSEKFFLERGVPSYTRDDGKVFPSSLTAQDILSCLLNEIEKNNGTLCCGMNVNAIQFDEQKHCYQISTVDQKQQSHIFKCKNLVIATGGKSYPTTGSDGSMIPVLQAFHDFNIIQQRPALVPIYVENYSYEDISGISVKHAKIKKGKKEAYGDLLFTHKNLSGPLILNFSRYLYPGDHFEIDFIPNGFKSGDHLCIDAQQRSLINYLIDETQLPKALLELLLHHLSIDSKQKTASLHGNMIKQIEKALRSHQYVVSGNAGFTKAMATTGGISLNEVSTRTMESKKCPGLYFIGEILDVDGDTGGYNIQFAFSSAYALSQHLLEL